MEPLTLIDGWTWVAFAGAVAILLLTPGPSMMLCIACGLRGGPLAGVAAAGGAAIGMVVHSALAAFGVASLLAASPVAFEALRYGGAAYLLWLGWESWAAGDEPEARLGRAHAARALGRGLATNLANPKVILFMVALLPQFADPEIGPVRAQIMTFGMVLAAMTLAFDGVYGGFAGVIADRARRASGLLNKISATVFGGLAYRVLAD